MIKAEITQTVPGKTPTDCFAAACAAYPKLDFELWKKREIAWLVMAKKKTPMGEIDSNFSARPTNPTSCILTVSAENYTEQQLEEICQQIFAEIFILLNI